MPQALDSTIVQIIAYLIAGTLLALGNRRPKPGIMSQKIRTAAEDTSLPLNGNGKRQDLVEDRIKVVEQRLGAHDERLERIDNQLSQLPQFMLQTTLSLNTINTKLEALAGVRAIAPVIKPTEGGVAQ